jgi:hypothetical protein
VLFKRGMVSPYSKEMECMFSCLSVAAKKRVFVSHRSTERTKGTWRCSMHASERQCAHISEAMAEHDRLKPYFDFDGEPDVVDPDDHERDSDDSGLAGTAGDEVLLAQLQLSKPGKGQTAVPTI